MKYLFMNFILFFFLSPSVFAKCSDSELKILNDVASKVKITYQYNEEYEKLAEPIYGNFSLFITGVTNDIYVYDYNSLTNYFIADAEAGVITVKDIDGGDRKLYIMSNNSNCKGKLINTKNVNVPKFNYFAVSKYCEGIDGKEFVYCDKWYQYDINKANFLKELEIYKAKETTNDNPVDPTPNDNNDTTDNWVKVLLREHYIIFTCVVVLIVILFVYFISKRRRGDL